MTNDNLQAYVEQQINEAAQKVIDKGDKLDDLSQGKLDFFIALRHILTGNKNYRSLGHLDAVNDTLQHLGLIESSKTFYK